MAKDVIMPVLGMNQDSGVLVRWLVEDGAAVNEGEPLIEVETDKAVVEVPAMASGVLANLTADEGDEVPTGTVIGVLLDEVEAAGYAPGGQGPAGTVDDTVLRPVTGAEVRATTSVPPATQQPARIGPPGSRGAVPDGVGVATTRSDERPLASPKARRLARELGLDLGAIRGSGPYGAVRAVDLIAALGGGRVQTTVEDGIASTAFEDEGASVELGSRRAAQDAGAHAAEATWLRRDVEIVALLELVEKSNAYLERNRSGPLVAASDVLVQLTQAAFVAAGAGRPAAIGLTRVVAAGHESLTVRGDRFPSLVSLALARSGVAGEHQEAGTGSIEADAIDVATQVLDLLDFQFEAPLPTLPARCMLRVALAPGFGRTSPTATLTLEYRSGSPADPVKLMTRLCELLEDPVGVLLYV